MPERDGGQLIRDAVEAWNVRDVDRYAVLLSDDCLIETYREAPLRGHEAARKAMQRYLNAYPDLYLEVRTITVTLDLVTATWSATGTPWNDLRLSASRRRRIEVEGFTVAGLKDGRFVRLWHYWDPDRAFPPRG